MNLAAAQRYYRESRITDADIQGHLEEDAQSSVRSVIEYHEDVARIIGGLEVAGDPLPWKKTHHQFRFRPGEVTLWHGINGHGKSAVTGQVALWLSLQGRKTCLASFEMAPKNTIHRMICQAAGNPQPSVKFATDFFLSLAKQMWLYDRRGRVDPKSLFAAIRFCAKVKGTSHFFVDSMMKCVPREDDYGAQSDFINGLCAVAHETDTHVHLVHHVRKFDDENKVPGKFDARGAGAITDQVDNVIAVWRNKKKEREREEALRLGTALNEETPDFLLACDKQRNGTWEGIWALWGAPGTWHFRESPQTTWTRGYELPTEPGSNG